MRLEPRPRDVPARTSRDWMLVAGAVALVLAEGLYRHQPVAMAAGVLLAPTLLWRRSRPLLMVAVAFAVLAATPASLASEAYLWVLPFALFRWGSGAEAIGGAVIVAGKICLFAALGRLGVAEMLLGFVVLAAVFAPAAALRYRAVSWARELDHARLVQREQLARDLNDTVAHRVSAMAVSARAGLAAPDAARDSLQVIEAEATRALAEMRSMVHTLREQERG